MLINISSRVSAVTSIVFTCFLISFFYTSSSAQVKAREYSKHSQLTQDVSEFLHEQLANTGILIDDENSEENINVLVREVDQRIKIPSCPSGFQFNSSQDIRTQTNLSVKVTCHNLDWYLFVHAKIAVTQQVVVSRDNLSPGSLLSSRDLTVIEVDKSRLRGSSFNSIEDVAGARLKRRIRAGHIIDDRMLCYICKGDRVTIAAVSGNLQVKVYGVAEQDGVLGDTIQVRNISTNKLVFARVASTSQVEISI